ncbi:tetratricopeptide repeat protein [Haliangium sp.]|uniref:tetratricopeptide repeat protein n=1 Tax=Haliangium sp. TaxID=2663208 RepID=UPI003D1162EE
MNTHEGDFEDSLEQARSLLSSNDSAADLWDANDLVNHAVSLRPYDGEAWLLKSQVMSALGDEVSALAAVEMAVRRWPRAPEVHYWRAAILADLERLDEALHAVETAFRLLDAGDDGLAQDLFYEKAMVLESMGEQDKAMAAIHEGLARYPESAVLQAGAESIRRERIRATFKVLPGGLG